MAGTSTVCMVKGAVAWRRHTWVHFNFSRLPADDIYNIVLLSNTSSGWLNKMTKDICMPSQYDKPFELPQVREGDHATGRKAEAIYWRNAALKTNLNA